MQIVIDIPEEIYDRCREYRLHCGEAEVLEGAVANGTVLPKGHGRLIDAEQLMNYCQNQIDGHKYADCNVIARFPVVLNAEEENNLSFCGARMDPEVKENGSK